MPLTLAGSGVITGADWGTSGAGLVKIATQSFSAASTVSINNCFTSTYDNYVIVIHGAVASGAVNVQFRMRAGGVDDTTANYHNQLVNGSGATAAGVRAASQTSGTIMGSSTTGGWAQINVFNPALAVTTYLSGFGGSQSVSTPQANGYTAGHAVATAFDGITFFPASSTITGSLTVYGYTK